MPPLWEATDFSHVATPHVLYYLDYSDQSAFVVNL
jgi:hypothetical protein